jgi:hypothetical protein
VHIIRGESFANNSFLDIKRENLRCAVIPKEISNIPYIFTMLTFKCEHLQDQNEKLYTLKCHQSEGIITRSRSLVTLVRPTVVLYHAVVPTGSPEGR